MFQEAVTSVVLFCNMVVMLVAAVLLDDKSFDGFSGGGCCDGVDVNDERTWENAERDSPNPMNVDPVIGVFSVAPEKMEMTKTIKVD